MDPTESIRREMVNTINTRQAERLALEALHGKVWDTKELQEDFEVHSFLAPFVSVTRKKDGKTGALTFQHMPRYYFNFIEMS